MGRCRYGRQNVVNKRETPFAENPWWKRLSVVWSSLVSGGLSKRWIILMTPASLLSLKNTADNRSALCGQHRHTSETLRRCLLQRGGICARRTSVKVVFVEDWCARKVSLMFVLVASISIWQHQRRLVITLHSTHAYINNSTFVGTVWDRLSSLRNLPASKETYLFPRVYQRKNRTRQKTQRAQQVTGCASQRARNYGRVLVRLTPRQRQTQTRSSQESREGQREANRFGELYHRPCTPRAKSQSWSRNWHHLADHNAYLQTQEEIRIHRRERDCIKAGAHMQHMNIFRV